jgi:glycerol transport system ATP-binding protein
VVQTGTADQLFEEPAHAFVGHFIGSPGMNFLPVSLADGAPFVAGRPLEGAAPGQLARWLAAQQATRPDAALVLGIRPEYVRIAGEGDAGTVEALIERVQDLGTSMLVTLRVGEVTVRLRAPVDTDLQVALATGGAAAAGQPLRICLVNSHTRFYRNQELIT